MSAAARTHVEDSLRRVEEGVAALDTINDQRAQKAARDLLEAVLGLYGLALARIAFTMAKSPEGRSLYGALAKDEQVKAVLLLHGLHPQSAAERIQAAIPDLEARLDICIALVSADDGVARLLVDAGAGEWETVCKAVGAALLEIAPDLDDIAIDRAVRNGQMAAAAR